MKKDNFLEHSIFSTTISDKKIDIDVILDEFHNNTKHHTHTHSVMWDAANYSSGVYFVKMIVGEYISTQKLMLVK